MSQLSYLKDEASGNDTGGSLVRRRENDNGTNKTPLEDMSDSIHLGTVKEYNSNIKQRVRVILHAPITCVRLILLILSYGIRMLKIVFAI